MKLLFLRSLVIKVLHWKDVFQTWSEYVRVQTLSSISLSTPGILKTFQFGGYKMVSHYGFHFPVISSKFGMSWEYQYFFSFVFYEYLFQFVLHFFHIFGTFEHWFLIFNSQIDHFQKTLSLILSSKMFKVVFAQ